MNETKVVNFHAKTTDRVGFALDILKKFEEEINSAKRILVKPNIVSGEEYPTTTHPELLGAVLDFLKGRDVVVADGMAVDLVGSKWSIARHPLGLVCEKHGVKAFDLHTGGSMALKSPRKFGFSIYRLPRNFDYVISLPVLKSHSICNMTGALKNQFGYITKAERIMMHTHLKDIHKAIAEVNALVPANLFIVDAVETLTGSNEVRHGGKRTALGHMLGGKDPVALDAKGLEFLQTVDRKMWAWKPKDVSYIGYAEEYGVGKIDSEVIES